MATTLEQITKNFLADTKYQTKWRIRIETRDGRMPGLRRAIREFTEGHINLEAFRNRLDYYLPQEAWDSSNQKNSREWLLAELTVLVKYHCDVYVRRGLSVLRDMGAITINDDISYHDGNIEIRSFEDYTYVKEALDDIVARVPPLRTTPAWAEIFTRWVIDKYANS